MSGQENTKTIQKSNSDFFQFVKGLIVSLIFTFAAIIVFALVIKFATLSDAVIVPVNLVIKCLAIVFGTIIFTKNKVGGLKKGILFAICYITLAFVIFSSLAGSFAVNFALLLDYVVGVLSGAIVGIIRVNAK